MFIHLVCVSHSIISDSLQPHGLQQDPPGSSVHESLQARILEWVAIPFSTGSFYPRDRTQVSCTTGRFFTIWATDKPTLFVEGVPNCLVTIESIKQTNWCFLVIQIELFIIY